MRLTSWARRRRRFLRASLGLAGLGLLAGCGGSPARTQPAARTPRIGELWSRVYEPLPPRYLAFLDGLRNLGWVEGRNVAFERRYADDRAERFPELAAELARLEVDVLVGFSGTHVRALKQATSAIPIVMMGGPDPVWAGFAESLAHPGGNITGTTSDPPGWGLEPKRLQLLKEAFPAVARVLVLIWADHPSLPERLAALQGAASTLGVELLPVGAASADDIERAFSVVAGGADALQIVGDPWLYNRRPQFMALAARHRMPAIYDLVDGYREEGGLLVYAANTPALYHRAAAHVDRILRGASPAELPFEQPTKFDFVVNLGTARALGLTIPRSILEQATEIIE